MALAYTTVWEVRATGSDNNGGAFNPARSGAGTDYSQQDAPQASGSVLALHATNANLARPASGHTVSSADVGNLIQITSGSGFTTGFYEIASITNTGGIDYWTLDQNAGTAGSTGGTYSLGGALASLGKVGAVAINNNKIFIKSGSYSITSSSANVPSGCFNGSVPIIIEGYQTTRGDLGTPPVLTASGISTFTVLTTGTARSQIWNIEINCAGLTSSRAFAIRGLGFKLVAKNCTNGGIVGNILGDFVGCVATGCTTQAAFQGGNTGTSFFDCIAYSNSATGFFFNATGVKAIRCLAINNSGSSSDGFQFANVSGTCVDCVAYGNGRDGFRMAEGSSNAFGCIAESNSGYGFNNTGSNNYGALVYNCAAYGNTSGGFTNSGSSRNANQVNFVNGSSSFFINAAASDFRLNNVAGAGASARSAGWTYSPGGQSYRDIGAIQHDMDVTPAEVAAAMWAYANRTTTS